MRLFFWQKDIMSSFREILYRRIKDLFCSMIGILFIKGYMFSSLESCFFHGRNDLGMKVSCDILNIGINALNINDYGFGKSCCNYKLLVNVASRDRNAMSHQCIVPGAAAAHYIDPISAKSPCFFQKL